MKYNTWDICYTVMVVSKIITEANKYGISFYLAFDASCLQVIDNTAKNILATCFLDGEEHAQPGIDLKEVESVLHGYVAPDGKTLKQLFHEN